EAGPSAGRLQHHFRHRSRRAPRTRARPRAARDRQVTERGGGLTESANSERRIGSRFAKQRPLFAIRYSLLAIRFSQIRDLLWPRLRAAAASTRCRATART